MLSVSELQARFSARFGGAPRMFSAPGRVNLIGEHTDYNDGFVLPMAIDRRTTVVAVARDDRRLRCYSVDLDQQIEFELGPSLRPAGDWGDYVRGVAATLTREQYQLRGADLLITSEVPIGAGLSSSAALEIAAGYALLRLSAQPVDALTLAQAAQRAEQEFTGTRCGIMDQYIACLGEENHALLIDCRSLNYEAVPLNLSAARVVVCNSMVKHELAAGEYNQRRAECEEGVRQLAKHLPNVTALRDVSLTNFETYAASLTDVVRRRCRHVITENERTQAAVAALRQSDLAEFGRLMYASHASLRDDYEVSCRELDLLVEIASHCAGVFGARMTGGGFGGCTVNLVAIDRLDEFTATITREYESATSMRPDIYICRAVAGVREEVISKIETSL